MLGPDNRKGKKITPLLSFSSYCSYTITVGNYGTERTGDRQIRYCTELRLLTSANGENLHVQQAIIAIIALHCFDKKDEWQEMTWGRLELGIL